MASVLLLYISDTGSFLVGRIILFLDLAIRLARLLRLVSL